MSFAPRPRRSRLRRPAGGAFRPRLLKLPWRSRKDLTIPFSPVNSAATMPVAFEMGNSPAQLANRDDTHRPLVLVSSSGTKVIHEAAGCEAVYLSCFRSSLRSRGLPGAKVTRGLPSSAPEARVSSGRKIRSVARGLPRD